MSAVTSRWVQALIRPSIMASSTPRFRKRLDHLLAADAGAVGIEEHQIGLGLLHLYAADLREPTGERPRMGVVIRQPIDMMVERMKAGGGANAGLSHRTAEALLPAPDLVDEIAGARDHAADRRAESLGEIDPGRIPSRGHFTRGDPGRDAGVQQPRPVHMGGKSVRSRDLHDLVEIGLLPDRAAADIGGLLDADHGLRRLIA